MGVCKTIWHGCPLEATQCSQEWARPWGPEDWHAWSLRMKHLFFEITMKDLKNYRRVPCFNIPVNHRPYSQQWSHKIIWPSAVTVILVCVRTHYDGHIMSKSNISQNVYTSLSHPWLHCVWALSYLTLATLGDRNNVNESPRWCQCQVPAWLGSF